MKIPLMLLGVVAMFFGFMTFEAGPTLIQQIEGTLVGGVGIFCLISGYAIGVLEDLLKAVLAEAEENKSERFRARNA